MGILAWLRPPAKRLSTTIARELAEATFALHPSALGKVIIRVDDRYRVVAMDVPGLDPARQADAQVDPASQTARLSQLVAELAQACGPRVVGHELSVMRDRVIWMPSVLPVQPPMD